MPVGLGLAALVVEDGTSQHDAGAGERPKRRSRLSVRDVGQTAGSHDIKTAPSSPSPRCDRHPRGYRMRKPARLDRS